jgi:hypothetical protein
MSNQYGDFTSSKKVFGKDRTVIEMQNSNKRAEFMSKFNLE